MSSPVIKTFSFGIEMMVPGFAGRVEEASFFEGL
jgi:hypothetical protein